MPHTVPSYLDRAAALLLLVSAAALLAMIALFIRATSYGPILEREIRIGDGREISIPRFRTTGAGTPEFRLLARFLRWSRYDRWPSLWSVVRGDITNDEVSLFYDPTA